MSGEPTTKVTSVSDEVVLEHIRQSPGIKLQTLCYNLDFGWAYPPPRYGYTEEANRLGKQLQKLRKQGVIVSRGYKWYLVAQPEHGQADPSSHTGEPHNRP